MERWDALWKEFEGLDWEGRRDLFLGTLDDKELMSDDGAFEMLTVLHEDAVRHGERARFTELVDAFAARQPDAYQPSAPFYLSLRLQDALAEGRQDILPIVRDLAAQAGRDIDMFNHSLRVLAYHGHLAAVVEALRAAWPFVQSASDILPWGVTEFGERGADYEIYNYLENSSSPDPRDQDLLDHVRLFIADPDLPGLAEFVADLAGQAAPAWTLEDFVLQPVRKKRRRDWDEDEEEEEEAPPDPGAQNLSRLITQFVGHLRRVEAVPYPKGELIRSELLQYFLRRHNGDLNPGLGMLEHAMHPRKKLPPPPKPGHTLCPERVTFEFHLVGLVGFLNGQHHTATALFELIPAWLRFLESRGLIDADRSAKTVEELRPLHAEMLGVTESYRDDPALLRALQSWPTRP